MVGYPFLNALEDFWGDFGLVKLNDTYFKFLYRLARTNTERCGRQFILPDDSINLVDKKALYVTANSEVFIKF
jgi:hypothetical protein